MNKNNSFTDVEIFNLRRSFESIETLMGVLFKNDDGSNLDALIIEDLAIGQINLMLQIGDDNKQLPRFSRRECIQIKRLLSRLYPKLEPATGAPLPINDLVDFAPFIVKAAQLGAEYHHPLLKDMLRLKRGLPV